jgi:hypothetical protein
LNLSGYRYIVLRRAGFSDWDFLIVLTPDEQTRGNAAVPGWQRSRSVDKLHHKVTQKSREKHLIRFRL